MAERTDWQRDLETELRALSRELELPPAPDLTETVRQRLDRPAARPTVRLRRPAWQLALAVVIILLGVLVATPQGRAAITHVLRFSGIELSQGPTSSPTPRASPSLPGERHMSLPQARRAVAFPILVPAALDRPDDVVVSDRGRVATLVYHRTPYGEVRMDEFDGHLDEIYFKKIAYADNVTRVRVGDRKGLWVKGPHELVYVTRNGVTDTASARLTHGNTLIWGTPRVALRLEGRFHKDRALAVARSAR